MKLQNMKRKAARTVEQNIRTAQNSKKETAGSVLKERKISENTRPSDEVKDERKCGHRERTKHFHRRKSQNSKAFVQDTLKKQRIVDVKPQQLQQSMQTKKLHHHSDTLQEHSLADCRDDAKKLKLCDTDRKLDETSGEVKLCGDRSEKEEADVSDKLQLTKRSEGVDESVSGKSSVCVKTETVGIDTNDKRVSVEKKTEHSKDSARQHVCRGLYRALSSR